MKRILLIQEAGRNPQNADYKEAQNFKRAFGRIGVDATVWGKGYDNQQHPFDSVVLSIKPDAILVLENYDDGWMPDLSQYKQSKLFWSVDSHKCLDAHIAFCKQQKIDIVLCAVYPHVEAFKIAGFDARFFPNAFPADKTSKHWTQQKKYGFGFCGCYGNRKKWIDVLDYHINNGGRSGSSFHSDIFVLGDAMVEAINNYHVHWNRNESIDINARTFETLGCGTCLLTNRTAGIDETGLVDGKHYVSYTGEEDCLSTILYLINNIHIADRIAIAGMEYANAHHTYDNRAQSIIEMVDRI